MTNNLNLFIKQMCAAAAALTSMPIITGASVQFIQKMLHMDIDTQIKT